MKQIDHNQFWLIKDNPITKAGVFPYLGKQINPSLEPDKIYQVYRPQEEIKKAADTFKLVPLVDNHTMLGPNFTPAEQKGVHGVLGENIKEKNGTLYADLKIFSEQLKKEIEEGKKELSLGYFCEYDLTPGQYNGMHYDAVQRQLQGNHIALVNKGRMGHTVRVMDSMAFDAMDIVGTMDDKWITVKPNGPEHKGRPVLIDGEGKIKAGMGGKFNEKHITQAHKQSTVEKQNANVSSKNETEKTEETPNAIETKKTEEAKNKEQSGRTYLKVPYKDKDEAKSFGARWDAESRHWYIPEGVHSRGLAKFERLTAEQVGALKKADFPEVKKKGVLRKLKDGFEVKAETQKGALIEKNGKDFWIQKRWIRADGSLTPAALASYERANVFGGVTERKEAQKARRAKLEKEGVPFKITWENENAVATDVLYDFYDIEKDVRLRLFFPKKLLKENGNVPLWLVKKKIEESKWKFERMGGYSVVESGFEDWEEYSDMIFSEDCMTFNNQKDKSSNLYTLIDGEIYKIENKKDLSSANNGVGGKDAAPEKENEMDKVQKAIEAIKALFADPEAGDKDGKLAEILGALGQAPAAGDACAAKDEDVDKRKLIDEIGGILKDKVSDEIIRTVIGKAEKIAYNDSEAGTADDEEADKDGVKEADEALTEKINGVENAVDAMPAKILRMLADREALYKQVSALVGTFDHATMTEAQVAKYACDKLDDLKGTPASKAVDVLKGYLKAQKPAQILSMDAAIMEDEKDAGFEAYMKGDK